MSETINTRKMNDLAHVIHMDRVKFYKDQIENYKSGKKPEFAVDIVDIFLFNEHGELFLQKRSKDKAHNAGLIDKSMGGHVQHGDSPEYTAMVETVQELQVPSIALNKKDEFEKTYRTLEKYLSTVAVLKPITKRAYIFNKLINGVEIPVANFVHLYFGVYGGPIKTVDREAVGILQYSLEDLEQELKQFPNTFTHDLMKLFAEHKEDLFEFVDQIKS